MEMEVAAAGVVGFAPPATVEMEYCWAAAGKAMPSTTSADLRGKLPRRPRGLRRYGS